MAEDGKMDHAVHPPTDDKEIQDWNGECDEPAEVAPPEAAAHLRAASGDSNQGIEARLELLQLETEAVTHVKDKVGVVPKEVEDLNDHEEDKKRHLNVVFIGHVDAGKLTTGGQILFLSGHVDDRTIQKYEREAKHKSRESWYMAYIMDTSEEERVKIFLTSLHHLCLKFLSHYGSFSQLTCENLMILHDGHKSYVPNMISGASQAGVGVLVISARKGEFETGYEKEDKHVQLAKTLGVSKLVVVVNKMDEPTVQWSKDRFDEIESKMIPFLNLQATMSREIYVVVVHWFPMPFDLHADVQFLPTSGLAGINMKTRVGKSICSWWNGPCLFEVLDSVEVPARDPKGPVRMPIIDKYKDMGTVVMGKIESGTVHEGNSLLVMPNKANAKVLSVHCDENKVKQAGPGENVRVTGRS